MSSAKVVYADRSIPDLKEIIDILEPLGVHLVDGDCKNVDDLISMSGDARVIVTEFIPLTDALFSACPNLELVVSNNIGYDLIDVPAATRRGIRICNNPNYCLEEVAEHTVAMLLGLARKITFANNRLKAGKYHFTDLIPMFRVRGSTVGFWGFGRIARLAAKKITGFGVRIIFHDPYVPDMGAGQGPEKVSRQTLLSQSDYLCLHMPLTPDTRHAVNAETLAAMKPTGCIINSARGEVVDTAALVSALDGGRLRGAALDVIENEHDIEPGYPLCQMDNVILTPHSAWYSEDALTQLKVDLANELKRFFKGEPLQSLLNPDVLKIG